MSESSLATVHIWTTKHSGKRNQPISKITIHHMAGKTTAENCIKMHINSKQQASAQYYIGNDGIIGQSVSEANRAWTSSSSWNDNRAITIEVSNSSTGGDWPISDKAYNSLINLCVDICQRNGIKQVNYTGDKNGVLTAHCFFSSTQCPGPYILNLLKNGKIVNDINSRLGSFSTPIQPPQNSIHVNSNSNTNKYQYTVNNIDYSHVFNSNFYYGAYADLQKAIGNNSKKLFDHFLKYGMYEGRQAISDFNVHVYRTNNLDLQKSFGDDLKKYYQHFCIFGHKEGRKAI